MVNIMSAAEAHAMSKAVIKGEDKEQIKYEQETISEAIKRASYRGEHVIKLHIFISDCVFEELLDLGYEVTRHQKNVWYDDETIIKW